MLEQDKDQPSSSNLPALIPSASFVLNRTQMTLGLLRDVVQESSADYWYEQGKKAYLASNFAKAEFCFRSCLEHEKNHWQAKLRLAVFWAANQNPINAAEALQQAYEGKYPDSISFSDELNNCEWEILRMLFQNAQGENSENFKTQLALLIVCALLDKGKLQWNVINELGAKHRLQASASSSYQRICGWSIMWCSEDEFEGMSHHYEGV